MLLCNGLLASGTEIWGLLTNSRREVLSSTNNVAVLEDHNANITTVDTNFILAGNKIAELIINQ